MSIDKGAKIKVNKKVIIPIMPPMLYGSLKSNKSYEVVKINQNELDLIEIAEGCRQQVSISIEQLEQEITKNSVQLI